MKNFDDARVARHSVDVEARKFTIGGETFVAKTSLHPDALTGWDTVTKETPVGNSLKVIDELVVNAIEDWDDAHGRWERLRARREDPVTIDDLFELVKWLMEATTDRPTGPPRSSTTGQELTGTPSTESSSSKVLAAA